jgi:hypothetical protein
VKFRHFKERDEKKAEDSRDEIHETTAGYGLLDYKRNEDVLEELKVDSVEKKLS